MTIQQATTILNAMRNLSDKEVMAMPFGEFQAIVNEIGESQYTFYNAGLFDLETESMSLEGVWFDRQMMGV
tara:strand:- start:368 stop:580 length:213 start_codon:yes stop_codon:yes gene_type:complete